MVLVVVLLLVYLPTLVQCNLVIYDGPGASVHPSDKYEVYVSQGGQKHKLFVYTSTSDHRVTDADTRHRSQSWTGFAFSGQSVTVDVHTKVQDFHTCTIRPQSYQYRCRRFGPKVATFHIHDPYRMVSVEFDYDTGEGYQTDIVDKLFIFADPVEHNAPRPHANGVLYYGPGVHKLNGMKNITCHSGVKEIYLAPGSYVHGGFNIDCDNVKIHGRGIITTETFPRHSPAIGWAILESQGRNTVVEGITMLDPTRFYNRGLREHGVMSNVKMVGAWIPNSDGVAQGNYGVLEDSFIIADDASVKFHGDHLQIRRLVIWQMQNGGVFLTGYQTEKITDVLVEDCDVIHTDWCDFKLDKHRGCKTVSGNDAVIDNSGSDHFFISDLYFRNIRVEGLVQRIVRYAMKDTATGYVRNVTVEHLSVEEQPLDDLMHNELAGSKHGGRIIDWKFIDLTIGNMCVKNYKDAAADFIIDENTADVTFECRGRHKAHIIG